MQVRYIPVGSRSSGALLASPMVARLLNSSGVLAQNGLCES